MNFNQSVSVSQTKMSFNIETASKDLAFLGVATNFSSEWSQLTKELHSFKTNYEEHAEKKVRCLKRIKEYQENMIEYVRGIQKKNPNDESFGEILPLFQEYDVKEDTLYGFLPLLDKMWSTLNNFMNNHFNLFDGGERVALEMYDMMFYYVKSIKVDSASLQQLEFEALQLQDKINKL